MKRISVNATKADSVSVERLKDGIAIRIEGGEKDLGLVVSVGLAKELAFLITQRTFDEDFGND
jgi:hypothetical protein